jgi:hypothetical protein
MSELSFIGAGEGVAPHTTTRMASRGRDAGDRARRPGSTVRVSVVLRCRCATRATRCDARGEDVDANFKCSRWTTATRDANARRERAMEDARAIARERASDDED